MHQDLIHGPVAADSSLSYGEVQVQDVYIVDSANSFLYLLYQIGNVHIKACVGTTILLGTCRLI
jgi:hypothetical protein